MNNPTRTVPQILLNRSYTREFKRLPIRRARHTGTAKKLYGLAVDGASEEGNGIGGLRKS